MDVWEAEKQPLKMLIPKLVKYVTLYGKRVFANVMKIVLKWRDYPGLSG